MSDLSSGVRQGGLTDLDLNKVASLVSSHMEEYPSIRELVGRGVSEFESRLGEAFRTKSLFSVSDERRMDQLGRGPSDRLYSRHKRFDAGEHGDFEFFERRGFSNIGYIELVQAMASSDSRLPPTTTRFSASILKEFDDRVGPDRAESLRLLPKRLSELVSSYLALLENDEIRIRVEALFPNIESAIRLAKFAVRVIEGGANFDTRAANFQIRLDKEALALLGESGDEAFVNLDASCYLPAQAFREFLSSTNLWQPLEYVLKIGSLANYARVSGLIDDDTFFSFPCIVEGDSLNLEARALSHPIFLDRSRVEDLRRSHVGYEYLNESDIKQMLALQLIEAGDYLENYTLKIGSFLDNSAGRPDGRLALLEGIDVSRLADMLHRRRDSIGPLAKEGSIELDELQLLQSILSVLRASDSELSPTLQSYRWNPGLSRKQVVAKLEEALPGADAAIKRERLLQHRDAAIFESFDIKLGNDNLVVLLTGANTKGKTTRLYAIASAVERAMTGRKVACKDLTISICDRVFHNFDLQDSLESALSTLKAQLLNLGQFLTYGTPSSLGLFDEILRGTSAPYQIAITWAAIERMQALKLRAVITTHAAELTLKGSGREIEELRGRYSSKVFETLGASEKASTGVSNAKLTADFEWQTGAVIDSNAFEVLAGLCKEQVDGPPLFDQEFYDRAREVHLVLTDAT